MGTGMKTENRGGARKGAGAPKKPPKEKRVKTSIQIPKWMLDIIDTMSDSRSNVIVNILMNHFKRGDHQ